ncbi:DNA mismatch repair protein PMS1-like protein 1 [Colletotrichum chlorophyti]|uniref:DNA mismatch repair protein PMS1 n=1 Tax=Colletotrichum chlorophyti TaxID=708187 RepID=A0A1Q8S2B8_9PEZI|nr:DNA mismatch repair protein PMS1-like protein 1 [Colletotrichum chlorophyti]
MATIKPIEGRTVHQIQSGQVIVDLCSVVKELVENSIDAGASSIDVRFKNQGLDSIEVQDNGSGITPDNYETIALKHYTSKISTYSDLATLQTFGFRGEALSSLCALSQFSIVTCLAEHVPKGTKLDFEISGKLKETHVIAAQKGTNVIVENLFHNLPVRRRELQRNIKREWNKVISLLNQYACIKTGLKFSVSQQPTKGKRIVLFSTKGNLTTRENLVNIFGAKTMTVLIELDMSLEFEPTTGPGIKTTASDQETSTEVRVQGYVSRPAHGEGRQTPDRQMFFVNGRPCGLPQFAKVFNEVYRAYNSSQSPFIFANIQLDTHLYDVNVSPDKRTILLHDQSRMLENLKEALVLLFQSQDYSIPAAQASAQRTQLKKPSAIAVDANWDAENESHKQASHMARKTTTPTHDDGSSSEYDDDRTHSRGRPARKAHTVKPRKLTSAELQSQNLISRWIGRRADDCDVQRSEQATKRKESLPDDSVSGIEHSIGPASVASVSASEDEASDETPCSVTLAQTQSTKELHRRVLDFNARLAEADGGNARDSSPKSMTYTSSNDKDTEQDPIPAITPLRMPRNGHYTPSSTSRLAKRSALEVATVTIGDETSIDSGDTLPKRVRAESDSEPCSISSRPLPGFVSTRVAFGSRLTRMSAATHSNNQQREPPTSAQTPSGASPSANSNVDGNELGRRSSLAAEPTDEAISDSDEGEGSKAASCELRERSSPVAEVTTETPPRHKSEQVTSESDEVKGDVRLQANVTESRSNIFKGGIKRKEATLQYRQNVNVSEELLQSCINSWMGGLELVDLRHCHSTRRKPNLETEDAEEVLSLIISKSDFGKMTIVGQFNLGFIIAVRHAPRDQDGEDTGEDELFIIDQHASDEKYNFERLQSTTVVQSQPLVHPKQLELTALEEEIVMENIAKLDVNGFKVHVDRSGDQPVGSRCKLLALPLSRETTFTLSDLEELISLLGDHHSTEASSAPRPSKVRAMFAMRACRSSVMIGKALSQRQMEKLIRHMGELDKPWNCPHGRPTMRHLSGLGSWDDRSWKESEPPVSWAKYARS